MKDTVVMVNPASGGGRGGRVWERIRAAVPEISDARLILAKDAATGRAELAEHLRHGARRVVAIGGDGTAGLVANVLLEVGVADRVAFGLVPSGTGSDLARSLGLPRDPTAALRRVLAAEPRAIDALRIETDGGEGRYAVNTCSAGLSGAVVPAINANPGRGQLSYLTATLGALIRYRPVAYRIEVDGEAFFDGGFFLAAFTNGQYFGRGMRVAPDAVLDDGLLDVVVIPPVPLWQLPYRFPLFLTGGHVKLPLVRCRRAERVRLVPQPGSLPYEVDGEILAPGPATVLVVPGALRVLA